MEMDFYEKRDDLDCVKAVNNLELTPIQKYYSGTSIFITGATGFIGRLLLEKLLRSCAGIDRVYLLLRPKNGKTRDERLADIFNDILFERLKLERPESLQKVSVLSGDCALPDMGLSPEARAILIERVSTVFHIAASLRLDEAVRLSYATNVRSTKFLLDLALNMKKLKAFIYMSTAYCHSELDLVDEKFYSPRFNETQLVQIIDQFDDSQLSAFTPKLVGHCCSTYSFTKSIAEDLIKQYKSKLPVAVVRPSIVIGCWREPLVNWINNIYGATGVLLGASLGLLRTWNCDKHAVADVIPGDLVTNTTLASAWHIANTHASSAQLPSEEPVYNLVSSVKAPITWGKFMELNENTGRDSQIASVKMIGPYNFRLEKSTILYTLQVYFMHLLPALFVDTFLKFKGKTQKMFKAYIKIYLFNRNLGFYCVREWFYKQENVEHLNNTMTKEDRIVFYSDLAGFSWPEYYLTALRGVRVYIVNDPMDTLDIARVRYIRMCRVYSAANYVIMLPVISYILLKMYHFANAT